MRFISSLIVLSSGLIFTACSYQPEDAGQCKLTCGSAIIGANDLQMAIKVKTAQPKTTCPVSLAGMPASSIRAGFLVGESILNQTGTVVAVRPVPNISIEPILIGARATVEPADPDPAYQGLRTPRDNWCSDACGVVSIEAVPLCPGVGGTGEVIIQVHSGALFSDPAIFGYMTESPQG